MPPKQSQLLKAIWNLLLLQRRHVVTSSTSTSTKSDVRKMSLRGITVLNLRCGLQLVQSSNSLPPVPLSREATARAHRVVRILSPPTNRASMTHHRMLKRNVETTNPLTPILLTPISLTLSPMPTPPNPDPPTWTGSTWRPLWRITRVARDSKTTSSKP